MRETNSLFYTNIENKEGIESLFLQLEKYAERDINPVYLIDKPLGESSRYTYEKGLAILIPKHKIMLLNYGKNNQEFENFCEDFIEDLGQLSKKYDYMKILGRPRQWRQDYVVVFDYREIQNEKIETILESVKLKTKEEERKGEFLISLLTGSINDVERTGVDYPDTILEKIRRKIVLFDGDQTRFIFDEPHQDKITIQGLAGTGKTELLLHKIKELYLSKEEFKIAFACHNKILAKNLRKRIPEFFNFMKVDEQIRWQEKLWVMSGWGSKSNPDSGIYSYICNQYNIPFERFSYNVTFDEVCRRALRNLNEKKEIEYCFDYILIDESQDFSEGFFELCKKVTKYCLYIAGDIFQNVFDKETISEVEPDFLLNKCYRTDPKTLMCAHAIGMGLFSANPDGYLRWLDDKAWESCGYDIQKVNGFYNLSRKPLRRFEDLGNTGIPSIEVISINRSQYADTILKIIEKLKCENPTLRPDDIGIMFLENENSNYQLANTLQALIGERFNWDVNIGYESKEKRNGAVFVSNRNNVKGLEFPFVICLMQSKLDEDLQNRNSIYMMLTRSFITSYLIMPDEEGEKINEIKRGVNGVNENGFLHIMEPNKQQKLRLNNAIISRTNVFKSQHDIVEEIMDTVGVEKEYRTKIHNIIKNGYKDQLDKDRLHDIVKVNYSLMN